MALTRLKNLPLKQRILAFFLKTIENEAFGSPFIIEGCDRGRTHEVAAAFAHEILLQFSSTTTTIKLEKQSHPDFFTLLPEAARSMHSISEIKWLIEDAGMPPFEGKYKVYLIVDSEAMLPVHANALLKTLEDKYEHTIILLTTTKTSHLLPTIVSRSKVISLDEVSNDRKTDAEFESQLLELLTLAQAGQISQALDKIPKLEKTIEEGSMRKLEELIDTVLSFYRDLIVEGKESVPFEKIVDLTQKIHLGYVRHMKIKTLLETIVMAPARLSS